MQITVQNSYHEDVWVAICFFSPNPEDQGGCGYQDGGYFGTKGWAHIVPGGTAQHTPPIALFNFQWYFYAESSGGAVWAGQYIFEVNQYYAFNSCIGLGHSTDDGPQEWIDVGFREVVGTSAINLIE
jgi:hypothetical protein